MADDAYKRPGRKSSFYLPLAEDERMRAVRGVTGVPVPALVMAGVAALEASLRDAARFRDSGAPCDHDAGFYPSGLCKACLRRREPFTFPPPLPAGLA